jgi:hypothetical protein
MKDKSPLKTKVKFNLKDPETLGQAIRNTWSLATGSLVASGQVTAMSHR